MRVAMGAHPRTRHCLTERAGSRCRVCCSFLLMQQIGVTTARWRGFLGAPAPLADVVIPANERVKKSLATHPLATPAQAGAHCSATQSFISDCKCSKNLSDRRLGPGLRRDGRDSLRAIATLFRFLHTLEGGNPAIQVRDCSFGPAFAGRRLLGLGHVVK